MKLSKKQRSIFGIGILCLLIIGGVGYYILHRAHASEKNPDIVAETHDDFPRHPLTGEKLAEEMKDVPQVYGVMIENSADAWPLSGVEDAFLVIEAPVEGNIPRFLAFFSDEQSVERIGPVRSARPYYLDWAEEFSSLYVHVGGSPQALSLLAANESLSDLNEFYQGEYFWRDHTRYAPHNAYTSTELLAQGAQEMKMTMPMYDAWMFTDDAVLDDRGQESASLNWSDGSLYDVAWRYQQEENVYLRMQGKQEVTSADGDNVDAANIIVLETDIEVIDAVGRRSIETLGEGKAIVFQNGTHIDATWKKNDASERSRFYDRETGEEISFVAGKSWIEVVDNLGDVTISFQEE